MTAARARSAIAKAKRLVVKVGSSVLTADGALRRRVFSDLARQIAALMEQKREVVLVSSGAIAIGSHTLGWSHPGRSIPEKQAAAAVGQIGLVELYRRRFLRVGLHVGQVLVTRTGLEDRERFLNARHTLLTLLRLGVVPIVNENDTVATEEIRFGDNDNLSATVVNLVGADLLVLLTDVDGLYQQPPRPGEAAPPLFDVVEHISAQVEAAGGGSPHALGRGGMLTKLEAARGAAHSGAATLIANGLRRDSLLRAATGEPIGTLFLAGKKLASRKHWLAFTARTRGRLVLDAGAVQAVIGAGRSLLPAGITAVEGEFGIGESVSCVDDKGHELARGLVAYSSAELTRIQGLPTRKIAQVLGYSNGDAVIHRDDLAVMKTAEPNALQRGKSA